jgi:PncC family amidohydrolase
MNSIKTVLQFLKKNNLILTTAESCTGGRIIHLLSSVPSCGDCIESAYVVYSAEAKKRILGVKSKTIKLFTLTSEEVAREMAIGALKKSMSNVAIASTGIAGSKPMDGIPPGTVCFAWAFKQSLDPVLFSTTYRFEGKRSQIQTQASYYALQHIEHYFSQIP